MTKASFAAAAFAVALGVSTAAHATDWYVYNFSRSTCRPAARDAIGMNAPEFRSPGAAAAYLRRHNTIPDITVQRNDDGDVTIVEIDIPKSGSLYYFPTPALCAIFAGVVAAQSGTPDELR